MKVLKNCILPKTADADKLGKKWTLRAELYKSLIFTLKCIRLLHTNQQLQIYKSAAQPLGFGLILFVPRTPDEFWAKNSF